MQSIEQALKAHLDGTFRRMEYRDSGVRYVTDDVAIDFMPDFSAVIREEPDPGKPKVPRKPLSGPRRYWTAGEDKQLMTLRDGGMPFRLIGPILGRSPEASRDRLKTIRRGW